MRERERERDKSGVAVAGCVYVVSGGEDGLECCCDPR